MSVKQLEVSDVGLVNLYKRKGSKSVRLTIGHDGTIKVSLPNWMPYRVALEFVKAKREWISQQLPMSTVLTHNQRIGKAHHIHFEPGSGSSVTTRITGNQVRVLLPVGTSWQDESAQSAANKAGIKALKKEANQLLPTRLQTLADMHGFTYRSVAIKQLKGRWGSCSQHKDIVLNCFLMQLPWELIDYVLLHELTHTDIMAHGPKFWHAMESVLPNVQHLRKEIKKHKPLL